MACQPHRNSPFIIFYLEVALLLQHYDFIHQQTCFKTTTSPTSGSKKCAITSGWAVRHFRSSPSHEKKGIKPLCTFIYLSVILNLAISSCHHLREKNMLRDCTSNTEIVIWFHFGVWVGGWGLFCFACRKYTMDYFKWIYKLEKCSHNINAKERLLGIDYYLLNMWIIETFNFWSMNNIYEFDSRWKQTVLSWALLLSTFSGAIFFFGGSCHCELV